VHEHEDTNGKNKTIIRRGGNRIEGKGVRIILVSNFVGTPGKGEDRKEGGT